MRCPVLLWMWLLGCQPKVDELATQSLAAPQDLATCAQISFVEAADICRLEVGQRRARNRDSAGAKAACTAIQQPLWKEECYFITAEVLGRRVNLATAIEHCDQAGRYDRFCYIHVAWWAQRFDEIARPAAPDAGAAVDRFAARMAAIPSGSGTPRWREVVPMLRSAAWLGLYYGSGSADPVAARSASDGDKAFARTAFAWEAARLIQASEGWSDLLNKVALVWEGKRPPPTGSSFGGDCWRGRLPDVIHVKRLSAIEKIHTIHGGLRLAGETPAEDLTIATLEAMFFIPEAPSEIWAPWMSHDSLALRATVARLGMMAGADDAAWRQQLSGLKEPAMRDQILRSRNRITKVWQVSPSREGCP